MATSAGQKLAIVADSHANVSDSRTLWNKSEQIPFGDSELDWSKLFQSFHFMVQTISHAIWKVGIVGVPHEFVVPDQCIGVGNGYHVKTSFLKQNQNKYYDAGRK